MNREKVKYYLNIVRNYLEIALVIYLVYTFVRTVFGVGFSYYQNELGEPTHFASFTLKQFFLNSALYLNGGIWYRDYDAFIFKYRWLLWLERFLVFIVPLLIIGWIELKKHNEKVIKWNNERKEKAIIKKQQRLENELNKIKKS